MEEFKKNITKEFGQFEVKLTESEAIIGDKNNDAFSFVFYLGGMEHALISYLITKDDKESNDGLEMLVYLASSMRMLFSSAKFKDGVFHLLMETIAEEQGLDYDDEPEEEIIENLRREQEEKEKIIKDVKKE